MVSLKLVNSVPIDVVIMAAGKGTRMKSAFPKVLQRLAGKPLIHYVLETAAQLQARQAVLIVGHGAAQVEQNVADFPLPLVSVLQEPQLGTGHAVLQALPQLADDGVVLVLSGDVPLIAADTLQALVELCAGKNLALLTIELDDPKGYGRILREGSLVRAIVEEKDATDTQRAIREIYSGMLAVPASLLKKWVLQLDNKNAQGEYYLTDIVKLAARESITVLAHTINDALQVTGINNPAQLASLERAFQLRQAHSVMEQGVRLMDPSRFDLRGTLTCAQDVEIDVNCIFQGNVALDAGVKIGANCFIANCHIAAGAVIHPYTHIDGEALGVNVGENALIGPFARLRPGAFLGAQVHIGNFVEVKNSTLAKGAKANHLAYLGDATVGERVNYGAGSITANYDGANKHRTVIGADVHIGSNVVLVAPVTIGDGATVGAGSTITKNAEPGSLTVARGKQVNLADWKRPNKSKPP